MTSDYFCVEWEEERSCIGEGDEDLVLVGACTVIGRVGGGVCNLGFGDVACVGFDETVWGRLMQWS